MRAVLVAGWLVAACWPVAGIAATDGADDDVPVSVDMTGIAGTEDSLAAALQDAWRNAPSLDVSRLGVRSAAEDIIVARGEEQPVFGARSGAGAGLSRTRKPGTGLREQVDRNLQVAVSVSRVLYDGGAISDRIAIAEIALDAGRARQGLAEMQLLLRAAESYMEYWRARNSLAARVAGVSTLTAGLRRTAERFRAGLAVRADIARARARLSRARADLVAAGASLRQAVADFSSIVGREPGHPSEPGDLPLARTMDRQKIIDHARQHHPRLVVARHNRRTAMKRLDLARSAVMPKVSLKGELAWDRAWADRETERNILSGMIGLEASVRLSFSGADEAAVRSRSHALAATGREEEDILRDVTREVTRAIEDRKAAWAAVEARERQFEATVTALGSIREAERVGVRPAIELLDAEQEKMDAEQALIDARKNAYMSGYRLLFAAGRLFPENVGLPSLADTIAGDDR